MNRYLPKQHGAWAMLILPFLIGLAASEAHLIHIPLFMGWLTLYLFSFPVLQWIKTGKSHIYRKPAAVYGVVLLPLIVILVGFKPALIWYGVLLSLFFVTNVYYAKTKNERALLNDIAAILLFCTFVYPVMYVGGRADLRQAIELFLILAAYFVGTALYVKTVIRERNNPRYYAASVLYHLVIVLMVVWIKLLLLIPFIIFLIRAIWLPMLGIKAKQSGIGEIFFSILLYASVLLIYW